MSDTHIPAALRRLVRERAFECCEYCLVPGSVSAFTHPVDHIISEKHGGPTEEANLALSCALCNGLKGSDLASIDPVTGLIVPLFHPRRDRWSDHFQLIDGFIQPLTPVGRVTARLLHFNDPERVAERKLLVIAGAIPVPPAPAP